MVRQSQCMCRSSSRSAASEARRDAGLQLAMAYHTMAILAREVFFRRSLMMASGSMSAPDAVNIVVEKATTFAEAAGEAIAAVVKGEDPVGVATRRSNPTARGRRPTCANC